MWLLIYNHSYQVLDLWLPSWIWPNTWYLGFTRFRTVFNNSTSPARTPFRVRSPWPAIILHELVPICLSYRECGHPRHICQATVCRLRNDFDDDGQLDSTAPKARSAWSNPTTHRRRNHLEVYKQLPGKGDEGVHTLDGTEYSACQLFIKCLSNQIKPICISKTEHHNWPIGGECVMSTSTPSGIKFHLSKHAWPLGRLNAQLSNAGCLN